MIQRRSKISKLPAVIRDQLNESLDAGVEYPRILDWLAEQGHSEIQAYHLSRWKDSGFQDWLARHQHTEELEMKLDWIEKLAGDGPINLQKASLAVLSLKLFDNLNRTDSVDMNKLLELRPEKIPSLINCFARFSHESLEMAKFQEVLREKQQAAKDGLLADKGAPTPETIKRMKQELRLFFRKLLASETATATATPPQQNTPTNS